MFKAKKDNIRENFKAKIYGYGLMVRFKAKLTYKIYDNI
jgi:hypothetical protein